MAAPGQGDKADRVDDVAHRCFSYGWCCLVVNPADDGAGLEVAGGVAPGRRLYNWGDSLVMRYTGHIGGGSAT